MISLKDLQTNLKEYGKNIFKIPMIIQYNKRDLEDDGIPLMPIDQMDRDLNRQLKVPAFPGSAVKGTGVGVALKSCLMETLKSLQKEFKWAQ
jgi:signal recognition particle receptor subunit beta